MTICYFGFYNQNYNRNRVLLQGLMQNNVSIIQCRSDKQGIEKYFDLLKKHWSIRKKYDVMIVGFPGYQAMILARFLTCKPIIFDAFSPLYDSMVNDRGLIKKQSIKAMYYWILDFLSMRFANLILFDTNQHIDYVSEEFFIRKTKLKRIFVGASPDIYFPQPRESKRTFSVFFFGTFIPLHGIEYIIQAAKLLEKENIIFHIIGDGQEKKKTVRLTKELQVNNIEFSPALTEEELAYTLKDADICLGIFGKTQKTQRVIPNKVYIYSAMQKPIITADTPAIRELFNEQDLLLIPTANARALAEGILQLKNDENAMEKLSKNCYSKFTKNATPDSIGLTLSKIITGFFNK